MTWDATHQMLYVATADIDPAHPNSIVAIDPNTATIAKAQFVGSRPAFLDTSAGDTYLYIGYDGATNETRLTLPGIDSALTWTLANAKPGIAFFAGDLKAAPESAGTTAVTLFDPDIEPPGIGGLAIFDGPARRPNALPGMEQDVLAWGSSDAVLAAAESDDASYNSGYEPLFTIAVNSSGATLLGTYQDFNPEGAGVHSDFGTGLIYSDGGKVANPVSGAIVAISRDPDWLCRMPRSSASFFSAS